jgi:hypothetical protein
MAPSNSNKGAEVSRRDFLSGGLLKSLLAPLATSAGVGAAARFGVALESALASSPIQGAIPVRCPW